MSVSLRRCVLAITTCTALLSASTPAAYASAAPILISVLGGGPDGVTILAAWSDELIDADETKFEVWNSDEPPALVASGTADSAVISGDTVTLNVNAPLTNDASYQLLVRAGGVSDDPSSNEETVFTTFIADGTAPSLTGSEVDADALQLTFDEDLDEASIPDPADFTVTVDDEAISVIAVEVSADTVALTLATAVAAGATVILDFAPSDEPLRDVLQNEVEAITAASVENATAAPSAPPVTSEAAVDGDDLFVTFDQLLDEDSVPASDDFAVTADSVAVEVESVEISADTLGLTLANPVQIEEPVLLSYTPGATPLLGDNGEAVGPLTDEPIDNLTYLWDFTGGVPLDVRTGAHLDCLLTYNGRTLVFGADDERRAACGTFLHIDGVLYGAQVPGPSTTSFDFVSMSQVTGAGTEDDPFQLVTVVEAADGALRLTQTDTYVEGADHSDSVIEVQNLGTGDQEIALYRAMDCMVDGDDFGFGALDEASDSVRCVAAEDPLASEPTPGAGYVEFTPLTEGARYEAGYEDVWTAVESGAELTNTCACGEYVDNGMAVGWQTTLAEGASEAFTVRTAASLPAEDGLLLTDAAVDDDLLTLSYDRDLDPGSVPSTDAYTVTTLSSGETAVTEVEIDGMTVLLTLAATVSPLETAAITYDNTTANPVMDPNAVLAASLSDEPVTNRSAPELDGATVDDADLTLDYDEALNEESVPPTTAYVVNVDGQTVPIDEVAVIGDAVALALANPVSADQDVTVSYTPPEADLIEDLLSNAADPLTDQPIQNLTDFGFDIDCVPETAQAGLTNMGFETGGLQGWSVGDVADVVEATSADDFTTPWEGEWMGRLGSTYNSDETTQPEGPNELCQDFVVEAASERFVYNIFTYDYTGFDRFAFALTVTDPDTGEVLAAHEQDSWGVGGDTSLKTSGWQAVTLDLSGRAGDTVRLSFTAGGTQDDLFGFWVYLDSAEDSAPAPVTPVTDVSAGSGSVMTDPQTGQTTVAMPVGAPTAVTLETTVACDGMLGDVVLLFDGTPLQMSPSSAQPNVYVVTIPAESITASDGDVVLAVSVNCDDVQTVSQAGKIMLYDPSGTISDATTGAPVVGAAVTLYRVPGWVAKDSAGEGDCESNDSKDDAAPWSQPAPTDLGQLVSAASPTISPNVNPFITNGAGRYGWDVAAGCWYVVVTAAGYQSLTSTVVGVPPEVTDLDLELTPLVDIDSGEDDGGSGRSGGSSRPSPTATTELARAAVRPGPDGSTSVSLPLSAGAISLTLDGLRGAGTATVSSTTTMRSDQHLVAGPTYDVNVTGTTFRTATVCLPIERAKLRSLGATPREARLLHGGDVHIQDVTSHASGDAVCGRTSSLSPFSVAVPRRARIRGADRVATSSALSAARFTAADTAYLVSADTFTDALAAGPAAAAAGAPLLLLSGGELRDDTLQELDRLGVDTVVIVGGEDRVPSAIAAQIRALGAAVQRITSADAAGTSAAVSRETFRPGRRDVFVATAENFPDGLAGGAAAALRGSPLLLVTRDALPSTVAEELVRLAPRRITVLGGKAAISDAVLTELQAFSPQVLRLAGRDRFATAAAVSARYFGAETGAVFLATGADYPDVLAAVPAAALTHAPLLLTMADAIPDSTRGELQRMRGARLLVIGGAAAIADSVSVEAGHLVH